MTIPEARVDSSKGPVLLLALQGFALGITIALVTIPASAIFLSAYGSALLPTTYVCAAVAGIASSAALAAAFRRTALVSVAMRVLAGLAITLFASWAVLCIWDAPWVSFGLLALVPLLVPVGFIFVVGQAGMLLDVRTLKVSYGRVVAGFAIGFAAGGLASPLLLNLLGPTRSLLAVAALSATALLALVALTRRRFPAELATVESVARDEPRPTLRALSRNRFVLLIVTFQMLSAVESQWLDFNVLASAAERYDDSGALARFMSQFTAIAYGTDILFLLVLAGFLLHRFGLRYGLIANAVGVLGVVGAIIVAGSSVGMGATVVFALVVGARVTDLTLSDGASRTSLSAAYQAVPARLLPVTQATVEGLAVPVAIGVSGLVLLAFPSVGAAGSLVLPVLTLFVVIAWAVVGVLLYREYRVHLLANLRGRTLDPVDLTFDEATVGVALDQLLESRDDRDVRLGLDILSSVAHAELATRLEVLATDDRPKVRADAIARLQRVDPRAAAVCARRALDDSCSDVVAIGLQVLAILGDREDLPGVIERWHDADPDVKSAAATALSALGDEDLQTGIATEILRLSRSPAVPDRALAARLAGNVPRSLVHPDIHRALLDDADARVVVEALDAIRSPEDADLASSVARHLGDRRSTGAALDALVRLGEAALTVIASGLRSKSHDGRHQTLLVRACRDIGGSGAVALLHEHVQHRSREVGLAVMRALADVDTPARTQPPVVPEPGDEPVDIVSSIVRDELEHATHTLRTLVTFEGEPSATLLSGALRDELELIRARLLAAFSMRLGNDGFRRVVFQLAQRDTRSHALALEWLDVTLIGDERASVALLDPGLTDRSRLAALLRTFPIPMISQPDSLLELVEDRDGRWRRPWIKACALYAAFGMARPQCEAIIDAIALNDSEPRNPDEQIVHETLTSIRDGRLRHPLLLDGGTLVE